jgi:flagellar basal-body rod protein FlgB
MKLLNSASMGLLENALNISTLRQNLLSNNIANVETPGFKRMDVRFEAELQKALSSQSSDFVGRRTHSRHLHIGKGSISDVNPQIFQETEYKMNNHENNVDLDHEMAELAKNALRYNILVQQMNHQLNLYKTSIQGGGR